MESEKPSGFKLFWIQFKLLLRKNIAVKKRNRNATIIQFLVPFIVNFVLFLITIDDRFNPEGFNGPTWERIQPDSTLVGSLPVCDLTRMPQCVTPLAIVHDRPAATPESAAFVDKTVDRMMRGASYDTTAVEYFTSLDDFNRHIYDKPLSVLIAVHFSTSFESASLSQAEVTLQYNQTRSCVFGDNDCTTPWEEVALPVQLAVERALLEEAVAIGRGITDPEVSLKVAHQPFPNHEMVDFQRKLEDSNGVIFVLMGTLFSFYIQCSNLVVEKEKKLKLQLKMMGTRDTPMWLAWWLIFVFEAFVLAMIWVGTGAMVQFSIFLNTDFAVMFCFFFTLGLALAGFASFLSTFLRSTTSALGMSLFLFMVNWLIGGALTRILYTNLIPRSARNALSLLPSILYNKAYGDLNDAVGAKGKGMRWEHLSDNDYDCPSYCALFCLCDYTPVDDDPINGEPFYIFPIGECMEWFVFDWLLYAILAVYLDNVVPNAYGRRQPLWYLCLPSYWGFKRPANIDTSTPVSDEGHAYDDDVLREQDRVLAATDSGDAIRIVNLCKRFKMFTAVHKINFGVQNDSLFCLLGHNGAGKTTTFNMLSGMFPPTYGDAFIFGKSVRHELRQVQGMMGICPQHDVLWEELSAREHLELFAGLSLVESSEVPKKIAYFLEAVDLLEAANIPCGKYSGGMKRRLSVACSLIADPRVVYLDEPTTGMDPVNRRGVWDVIEKAKKNRVVVLTTHAMEEADTLGDVISIMSRGRLHCLGTSLHLKNKFGSGYQLDVTCPVSTHAQVSDFLASKIVGHRRVSETQFSAMVPLNKVSELEALYAAVEGGEGERLKMELAVSMCTLESVFIKIANQAQDPEALRQQSMSELPVADTATPGTVMVEIECPVGSKAGDPVQIMHEGQSFDLTVPAGINQGMKFQVQLPSSNGNGVPRSNSHERRAASSIGADPFPDVDGLLVDHIPFKGASFGTQFKALSLKNLTYQKRQCCTNVTFCILTVLWMFILFIFKFIPVWIGFDQNLACGINMTKANAVQLSIPNLDVLGEVVSTIDAVATLQSCVPDTDKNATDIEKMQGWAYAAMCGTTAVSRPNDRQRGQMRATFDVFGCDASFFDELVEKFSYYRSAGENGNVELFCSAEARPDITVTNYRGIPEVKQGVDCQQASFHFFATCSFPTICPSNSTETDDRTEISPYQATLDSFQTYGCSVDVSDRIFPFLGKQPRTYAAEACVSDYICDPTHECTAECPPPSAPPAAPPAAPVAGRRLLEALADSDFDGEETLALLRQYATHAPRDAAATSNAPETWHMGPTGSWMHLPTVQQAKHAAALQEGGGALTQAAAFLGALFGPVPAAPSRSSAASPRITRTRSAVPGLAAQEQQSRRLTESIATPEKSCTEKAMDFCRATTIISECPNTLNLMKAKTVPFSSEANTADIGALRYEPETVAQSDCRTTGEGCYERLQNLQATVKSGVMGEYSVRDGLSRTDHVLSAPNVSCYAAEGDDGVCSLSRSDLNQALYDKWYNANRSDIDYSGSTRRWRRVRDLEGAYQGAYHFTEFDLANLKFDYTVLYNSTYEGGFESTRNYYNVEAEVGPLVSRVHAALMRHIMGASADDGFEGVPIKHMDYPTRSRSWTTTFEIFADQYVVIFVLSFCLPLQVVMLVSEKQQYMREVMTMTGMRRSAFWMINWLYGYTVFFCQFLIVIILGYLIKFRIFISHDPGVVILLYLVYGVALTSFSCFISTLLNNRMIAGILSCCLVFLGGLYGYIVAETASATSNLNSDLVRALGLIPIWAGLISQRIISDAAPGFALGSTTPPHEGTYLTLDSIGSGSDTPIGGLMGMLILDFFIYTLLFVYGDMVFKIGPGVKYHPLFFTKASFWRRTPPGEPSAYALPPAAEEAIEVTEERKRTLSQTGGVRAIGLSKQYPKATKLAVQNVQFAVKPDECFGLLGSNGAGKSTTIHMLCGVHEPTSGNVLCGDNSEYDVKTHMTTIQSSMGVCTQDNLLWGELTGAEHLRFFGRLRRISKSMLAKHITYWLKRVNLNSPADRRKRSRAYSGGMKRRLSVANSFIGNPKLVYLDEPSTGLDPESRRQLWHAVLAAKKSKSIVLTTHALEEAEALCDRVGIMTRGLMRTLGTPTQLRIQFDQGYKFMLAVDDVKHEAAATAFVMKLMPGAALRDSINGVATFDVPKANVVMSKLFAQMESNKQELHIKDWGLSHTTLEEVFLKIVSDTIPTGMGHGIELSHK